MTEALVLAESSFLAQRQPGEALAVTLVKKLRSLFLKDLGTAKSLFLFLSLLPSSQENPSRDNDEGG